MCIYPCKDKYQESWNICNESREVDTTMCMEIPTASWVLNMEGNILCLIKHKTDIAIWLSTVTM